MAAYDCLIVDDEEALSKSTQEYFALFGVHTAWVPDGPSCMAFLRENTADLILLDINLGGGSGFALCRELRRETGVPILFISARTGDDDMLLALSIGGDDYVQKPYSLSVLLAKVKATLKRSRGGMESRAVFGPFILDFDQRRLFRDGVEVELREMEFKLLAYLVKNKGRKLHKDELFLKVWGEAVTGDGTLNVHIRRLREKIEDNPNEPRYIKTVWGVGYLFDGE